MRHLALVAGVLLAAPGFVVTIFICLSGTWGIMHGWPILVVSVPMLLLGAAILWYLIASERAAAKRLRSEI